MTSLVVPRMRLHTNASRLLLAPMAALLACFSVSDSRSAARAENPSAYRTETLRGHVVFHNAVFEKQTGVPSVPEARQRLLALEIDGGALVPLIEDVRGRAFRRDERLRALHVELVVRRYERSPLVQVIHVFELAQDGRYELDYWCEICAIAMFEKKECECCQGPVELRRRKLE